MYEAKCIDALTECAEEEQEASGEEGDGKQAEETAEEEGKTSDASSISAMAGGQEEGEAVVLLGCHVLSLSVSVSQE